MKNRSGTIGRSATKSEDKQLWFGRTHDIAFCQ